MRTAVRFTLAAAIVCSAPALADGPAERSRSLELEGRCEYGRKVEAYIDGRNGFAQCDTLTITQDGDRAVFDFGRSWLGSTARYEVAAPGDVLASETTAITRVEVRNRPSEPATGTCTIYRRDEQISTVTCVATARQLAFAANFVPRD